MTDFEETFVKEHELDEESENSFMPASFQLNIEIDDTQEKQIYIPILDKVTEAIQYKGDSSK